MQIVENEVVAGKTIVLDDKHLVNGQYTKCRFVYGGGEFGWVDTKFVDCQFTFTGAAQRTVNLLGIFGMAPPMTNKPAQSSGRTQ